MDACLPARTQIPTPAAQSLLASVPGRLLTARTRGPSASASGQWTSTSAAPPIRAAGARGPSASLQMRKAGNVDQCGVASRWSVHLMPWKAFHIQEARAPSRQVGPWPLPSLPGAPAALPPARRGPHRILCLSVSSSLRALRSGAAGRQGSIYLPPPAPRRWKEATSGRLGP